MPHSVNTDYVRSDGDPQPYLRAIAEAGFSHVHWVHQWNSDFLYTEPELAQIERGLREYGLALNDIHGSAGREMSWGSREPRAREAGLRLIENRIDMAARLGTDVVVMHFPTEPANPADDPAFWDRMRLNLDTLAPFCRARRVRLALENMPRENGPTLARVFAEYGPEFIGFCYDPGHGNISRQGLDWLERFRERLLATHLNDNHGATDEHLLPFTGTVEWPRLADILSRSSYAKPAMTIEVVQSGSGIADEREYLARAMAAADRIQDMLEQARRP